MNINKLKYHPFEKGFLIFSILLFSSSLNHLLLSENNSEATNVIINVLYFIVYSIATYLLLYFKKFFSRKLVPFFLLLMILLSFLSTFWSIDSFFTLRKSINILGSFFVAFYIAYRFEITDILKFFAKVLFVIALVSLFYVFFIPSLGLMDKFRNGGMHEGAWKGVFEHKNMLGKMMLILFCVSAFLYQMNKRLKYIVFMFLSIIMIIGSKSGTALFFVFFIFCLSFLFRDVNNIKKNIRYFYVSMFSLFFLTSFFFIDLLDLLGKDITLTGRTILWEQSVGAILNKPKLGYGYMAFWENAQKYSDISWTEAPHAHNFILDVFLSFGVVGVVAIFLFFITEFFKINNGSSIVHLWCLLFYSFILGYDMLESNVFKGNNLLWLLVMISSVSLKKNYSKND
jgi:exopolysaccharide production protein ExoQ